MALTTRAPGPHVSPSPPVLLSHLPGPGQARSPGCREPSLFTGPGVSEMTYEFIVERVSYLSLPPFSLNQVANHWFNY